MCLGSAHLRGAEVRMLDNERAGLQRNGLAALEFNAQGHGGCHAGLLVAGANIDRPAGNGDAAMNMS